ncbi:transmembrane protein, putative, partial [Bodo saltans]
MSDAMIFVGNATYSGGMACVTLGESGEATNSNITIVNTTTVARGVFATSSATALVLAVSGAQLASVRVLLDNVVVTDNPISGGLVSGGGSIAALFFANTTITAASFVIIRNSLIDVYN